MVDVVAAAAAVFDSYVNFRLDQKSKTYRNKNTGKSVRACEKKTQRIRKFSEQITRNQRTDIHNIN